MMKVSVRKIIGWSVLAILGVGAVTAFFVRDLWLPSVRQLALGNLAAGAAVHAEEADAHDHDEHSHVVRGQEEHAGEPAGAHTCTDHPGEKHAEKKHAEDEHSRESHAEESHEKAEAGHEHHEEEADHADKHGKAEAGAGHDPSTTMQLSPSARANVGLKLAKVELGTFERTISVPAMIVERPGRSHLDVAAPFTGKVVRIWPSDGETVAPGQPLFELRLTHEDLVEAQSEFLKTAEELEVVGREVKRLEQVAAQGAIAGKTMLERKYEQDKLKASLHAQQQRLLLHGLTAAQIESILATRTLVSTVTIVVPNAPERTVGQSTPSPLQVDEIKVQPGQHVTEGQTLCVLGDYAELYIQGKAFEDDIQVLTKAADNNWHATAVIANDGQKNTQVGDLRLLYLANKIDPETRAFLFYVQLPNRILRERTDAGRRYSDWQFRPGQRVQLRVPVEQWANRIVVPLDAVVQEGAESYVFAEHDGHFDRRPVHVEYRDQYSAVLANDDSLPLGTTIVVAGAYQVHLAMKNKAGGGVDPHAGHRH
jgi:multidrug efflux pump subunit AcrA (membrane-fusion protein)